MSINVGTAVGYLDLDTSKFKSALKAAQSSLSEFTNSSNSAGARFEALGSSLKSVGSSLTKTVSLPLLALGTAATKTSVDFESAFAGVKKTVDATDKELSKLEQGIRSMAKEMPTAATEIAGVAEAAGQLGIQTPNILGFTETMVMLGDSTNMSADEAATSLARLANITGMSQKDFDKLGSTIVALGNNLATTEAEITEMGLRLAGAGSQVGMSEAQILSFAGALSSVGINAEAGGSAFSKVMINMQLATETGGEKLKQFASVAGMSASEFKKAFQEDAASAIIAFIKGLGDAESKGKSAISILDEMEIKEVVLRDALLRAAGASDVFSQALNIGTSAWSENTALTNEAAQRYETLSSKMEIMKNKLTDVGITIGTALMPYLESLVSKIGETADWFNNLSPIIQNVIIGVSGFLVALGPLLLIIGNVIIFITKLGTAIGSLVTFFSAGGAGATALSAAITFITGPIGLAIVAITALIAIGVILYKNWDEIKAKASEIWDGIKDTIMNAMNWLGEQLGFNTEEIFAIVTDTWNSIKDTLGATLDVISKTVSDAWEGIKEVIDMTVGVIFATVKKAWDDIKDALSMVGDAIQQLIDGDWEGAKETIRQMNEKIKQIVSMAWNKIKATLSQAGEAIKNIAEQAWNKIKVTISQAMENIKTAISDGWKNIKNATQTACDNVKKIAKTVFDGIKEDISNALSNAFNTAKDWWNKITSIFTAPINAVVNIVKKEGKSMPGIEATEDAYSNLYVRSNFMDVAKEMSYANNAAKVSISDSIARVSNSAGKNAVKENSIKGSSSNSIVINNTYNSPKPASIRELKKQDEIQMRRLAMQLGF